MKKVFYTLVLFMFAAVIFTSCKKDYTCECTTTDSTGVIPTETSSVTFNATKSNATSSCDGLAVSLGTVTTKCTLK